MALVNKIDSNVTGLSFAEEASLGVLPGVPVWYPLEPNSYDDFGGELTTVARNPINRSRQRKKGSVVDLDASGGFEADVTYESLQNIGQGFFFATSRKKGDLAVTAVNSGTDTFTVASGGTVYTAGDLLFGKDFANAANNRVHTVVSSLAGSVTVGDTTATDTAGNITKVGHQFASGDAEIDVSGVWPALITTTYDLRQLGVIPGEWIYIGGDLAATVFASAENNGYACVYSVAQNKIEFHKTANTMVDDAGTGKTIRIFLGRVLKNERDSDIKRRTYQLERTLGAPDEAQPTQVQSEYLVGAVADTLEFTINTADKVTATLGFIATDNEQRTGVQGLKSGTRAVLKESDMFNTSVDFKRINLSSYVTGNAAPAPLFAFVQELSLSINNNCEPNKAIAKLGAFEVTAGTFEVSAELNVYFASVEAVQYVRQNADTTLDFHMVSNNQGISVDLPMLTLGDGRLDVSQDEAITLPLTCDAATGAKFNPNMDHTALIVFFDYLPDAAS